jgi:hypothetical protein
MRNTLHRHRTPCQGSDILFSVEGAALANSALKKFMHVMVKVPRCMFFFITATTTKEQGLGASTLLLND